MNAVAFLRRSNPKAFIERSSEVIHAIEDIGHSTDKLYRVEYQSNEEGSQAIAFIHRLPAPVPETMRHLSPQKQLDCGEGWPDLARSTTTLAEVIFRTRFWCSSHAHYVDNQHLLEESDHAHI
jgi:hypothetical protein